MGCGVRGLRATRAAAFPPRTASSRADARAWGGSGARGAPSFCRICPRIWTQTDCTRSLSLSRLYNQVPAMRGQEERVGLGGFRESLGAAALVPSGSQPQRGDQGPGESPGLVALSLEGDASRPPKGAWRWPPPAARAPGAARGPAPAAFLGRAGLAPMARGLSGACVAAVRPWAGEGPWPGGPLRSQLSRERQPATRGRRAGRAGRWQPPGASSPPLGRPGLGSRCAGRPSGSYPGCPGPYSHA